MEIVKANAAMLCNYEVMMLMKEIKEKKQQKGQGQLATITYETLKYLENSACSKQTEEKISEVSKAFKPFNLTKNEKLIMLNIPPTTPLEIQLVVDNSEERLTEDQVEQLVQIVNQHMGEEKQVEAAQ